MRNAQWKHSYMKFWFAGNGLAPAIALKMLPGYRSQILGYASNELFFIRYKVNFDKHTI